MHILEYLVRYLEEYLLAFILASSSTIGNDSISIIEPVEYFKFKFLTQEIIEQIFLTTAIILGISLTAGLIGVLIGGAISGLYFFALRFFLFAGLVLGLVVSLVIGLAIIIHSWKTKLDFRLEPNQGIWQSRNNAVVITSLCLIAWLLIGVLGYFVSHFLNPEVTISNVSRVLVSTLPATCWIGIYFGGGFACIQHFLIRLILCLDGSIPWNYARFLDYCTERLLLQRVGGRYRFIHKSLQEHFARMGSGE